MRYGITVVGGEPAGYTVAERATAGGLRTVLFEKKAVGDIYLNEGRIPTKTLLYSARPWNTARGATKHGITAPDVPTFDMGKVIGRRDKVVKKLAGDVKMTAGSYRVAIVEKEAVIASEENGMFRIVADGKTYEVTYLLVCTGSDTVIPSIPGLSDTDYWTPRGALESKELPRSLAIIGGGAIGTGFVSFFSSTGMKVSVAKMMPKILEAMDKETADMLRSEYLKRGINFYLDTKVTAASHEGVTVEKDGKASLIEAGKILVSIGHKANLDQVGLNKLNVELSHNGMKVDEHMQTSHPYVYACGDIAGRSMLAHTAIRENEVVVNRILGMGGAMNHDCISGAVYTNPEVAGVGKTEEELKALGTGYYIQRLPMAYSGRFATENKLGNRLCKLVLDDGDRVVGYRSLGNPASEAIVAAGTAVQHGYTVEELQKSIFPHPTMGETFYKVFFA